MFYKTLWLWLLIFAIGIFGCSRAQSPSRSTAVENKPLGPWRPGETVTYKWPESFKLPLEITLEIIEVPREILGPLSPIKADQKPPAQQPAKKFWLF